jgi:molybdate transport system ATP-binding protein
MSGINAHFRHRLGAFELDAELHCAGRGVTALTGPSGSGKTTLLRCLAGLEHTREGECRVQEEVWQDSTQGIFLPPHQRAVGYVFQQANLFPHLSVRANLLYGWRRIPTALRRVEPDHAIEMMGLAQLLERSPRHLSGGEQQRVAIARAVLTSPRLLLMDEPLVSLDLASKHEIFPYLERLHTDLATPVLYISHDPHELARVADDLVLMEQGRIVTSGPLNDVLTRLSLPLARGEQAMAVIEAQVLDHDMEYGLTTIRFSGGNLIIPRLPHAVGAAVRVTLQARDVSLALAHHTDTSILNSLPAQVQASQEDGEGHLLVRLLAGETPLLARVTRKSAHLLNLRPGQQLFAQVKSVAILR